MTVIFDQQWQSRLASGEAEAALQLADGLCESLYAHCYSRLGDREAAQQQVRELLVRTVREIGRYDPHRYGNDITEWVLGLEDSVNGRS